MSQQQGFDPKAALYCGGFIVGWTIGPVYIEYLTGYMDTWTQNGLRYSVACLFWLPLLVWTIRRGNFPKKLWKLAIPVAVINIISQSTWAASFYFSQPAFLVLLAKTCVLFVATISIFVFPDERPLLRQPVFWVGLLLAFGGTFGIVMYHSDSQAQGLFWGTFMALAHSFTFAIYTILIKLLLRGIDPRLSFSVITVYTAPCLMGLAFWLGKPTETLSLSIRPWSYVVISAVISIAIAHVSFYGAVKRIGANIPSVLLLVVPFTTLLVSSILFSERLTLLQGVSGLGLLAGVGLTMRAEQRTRRLEAE